MSNIVAIVKSLVGQVFAISVEGLKRQIFEGERLLQGEQVMAGLGGEVTLQMANGELINLGEGNTWQAGSAEAEETDNASDASLEQALAAGFDPTVDLEAPAAGPGATGGAGGAAGGGHSFVLLDETGLQLDPTIGFPTEGLNFANAASVELAGALDNGNTADTADSGTNTGTAGNSGGNGAGGETGQANSAPNALADTFTLDEDGSVAIDVLGNDTDLDGDTLSITQVDGQPISEGGSVSVSNGSVTLSGNQLVFTPNTNYQGPANFTYTISDGALTSTATVSGTINPVADLIAADDSASGNEDSVINASVTGNDSTTSGGTLSYALASDVSNGSLTLNADGSYSYTPNANFNGSDSFTYTVTDAASGESRTQTVSLTINPASPINNAPAANGTVAEQNDSDADAVSLDVSSFFADIDGDTLTYSASGLPAGLNIDSATGIISGTLDNSASQGGNSGAYSITVTATDPDGASVEQTFTWNVANPAPVAANDTGSADEDNTVTGDVLDNDNDPDGDDLSVTQFVVAGDPTTYTAGQNASVEGGTLVINGNGSYSFTPAANWNGTLPTVTYSLSDGEGGSDTATLIITVNPVNDAPSISAPDFIAAVEDISTPLTGISFSDIDAAAGDVVATLTVASGTLSANSGAGVLVSGAGDTLSLTGSIADINAFIAAAQVSYTGAQDASGDVELTLSLDDNGNTGSGGAQIASTTSVIQIAPVADAPIINLTLGAVVETTTTIDTSNAQSTDQGFTISAFSVNGNPGSISLNNSPLGFGVAGGASGNNVELGQNATGTERLNVVFDTAIASATVRFAWLSTVESAEYKLFDSNGLQIGGAIVNGVTDLIDPPITLTGTDNALISRIEFTAAAGVGNDYLINSISYVTSSSYPLTISVTPTDIDNSESISAVAVSIPSGATLSTGTFDPVEGTWSLPLVSDGSYVVSVDPATQAVTISGLEMTIPGSVSGTPNLITTATVVDGSDSVNAIFGSAGNDLINGSADDDILSGGLGNDSLNGNTGADTFLWRAGDTGNDVISDFNAAEGDRIDLSDLLQAENQSNILDYLRVDIATSTLEISTTGSLDVTGADVTIKLENGGVAVDLSSYGATSSDIVNSLIAGADPLVKVDHT